MNKQTEAEAIIKKNTASKDTKGRLLKKLVVTHWSSKLKWNSEVHNFSSYLHVVQIILIIFFTFFFFKKSWGFWEHCLSVHGFVCRCPCAYMFCTVFVFTTPRVCPYLYGWTPLKMRWEKRWRLISFIAVTNTKPPQPVGGLSHVWLRSVLCKIF